MKKFILAFLFLMLIVPTALAGAKNATFIEWFWNNPNTTGGGTKSAFFQTTGSGIVQAWTYNHPDLDNARFVIKPLSKFENDTECDEGWLRENPNWTAQGIYNAAINQSNRDLIRDIFPELAEKYLFCAYPME